MKKTAIRLMVMLLCICMVSVTAYGAEYLIPVGQVIGLELSDNTVTVAAFDDSIGEKTRQAGLCIGDKLLQIDEKQVTCAEDVRRALKASAGHITVRLERKGKTETVKLTPEITKDGPKLGVFLKQGVTGIGTVTFYDPDTGKFGTLGHGVNGPDGRLLPMAAGTVYEASVISVKQGRSGEPGQLRGAVDAKKPLGLLKNNTGRGVFGVADVGWQGSALPVAASEEIHTGKATILSTVSGDGVQEYSVEILKIYPKTKDSDRNLVIRVTDDRLLATTGGIVQGMSGSPIIQDGKLIGAVTHVLVNDPTTGYGIFIENMLDAAA
jgi:stage IV sporulation protein B